MSIVVFIAFASFLIIPIISRVFMRSMRQAQPLVGPASSTHNNPQRTGQPYPAASHLCDDEHAAEQTSSWASLQDLEPGYHAIDSAVPASSNAFANGKQNDPNYNRYSSRPYNMVQQELEDLRHAGIISNEEYHERLHQQR